MCLLSNSFRIFKKTKGASNRIYNKRQSLCLFLCRNLSSLLCPVLCIVLQFDIDLAHADTSILKISNTYRVISDPVNGDNNPKRIPGAIIRYIIKAENEQAATAENVVISLNLTHAIDISRSINWNSNIIVQSPNINSGANKALTDMLGDDEGEFVSNRLTVRCGNITNSMPCIVTYDVEITY